jgi:hypothetical protein
VSPSSYAVGQVRRIVVLVLAPVIRGPRWPRRRAGASTVTPTAPATPPRPRPAPRDAHPRAAETRLRRGVIVRRRPLCPVSRPEVRGGQRRVSVRVVLSHRGKAAGAPRCPTRRRRRYFCACHCSPDREPRPVGRATHPAALDPGCTSLRRLQPSFFPPPPALTADFANKAPRRLFSGSLLRAVQYLQKLEPHAVSLLNSSNR